MKLYIFDVLNKTQAVNKTYWINFRRSLSLGEWPANVLREEYNATLHTKYDIEHGVLPHIEFENEKDAVIFSLRFS